MKDNPLFEEEIMLHEKVFFSREEERGPWERGCAEL